MSARRERPLQKALGILQSSQQDALKIGDIAHAAGFSEISHFNRCFRRRFGTTPTAARGSPPD
jgi:transcriptional regulator GlxA family with amidase domain